MTEPNLHAGDVVTLNGYPDLALTVVYSRYEDGAELTDVVYQDAKGAIHEETLHFRLIDQNNVRFVHDKFNLRAGLIVGRKVRLRSGGRDMLVSSLDKLGDPHVLISPDERVEVMYITDEKTLARVMVSPAAVVPTAA